MLLPVYDRGLEILSRYMVNNLDQNGYCVATFPGGIFQYPSASNSLESLKARGVFIHAVIDLPAGLFSPHTNMPSKIIVFRRLSSDNRFLAELARPDDVSIVVENLIKNRGHKNPALGMVANCEEFADYAQFKVHNECKTLAKSYSGVLMNLKDVSKVVSRPSSAGLFADSMNCVFIPTVGTSLVVTSPSEFTLKPHNYIQVVLIQDQILAGFCAFFYNSPEGVRLRQGSQSPATIPKFTKKSVERIPLVRPEIESQKRILETELAIADFETQIGSIRRKFLAAPAGHKNIMTSLRKIGKADALDVWIENLPFPLASILRKYLTYSNEKEKRDTLLIFFEALSQFLTTMFLSCSNNSSELLKGSHMLRDVDASLLTNSSFGTWAKINSEFAKSIRKQLSDKDERDVICRVFGNMSSSTLEKLCSKDLFDVLNKAFGQRNDWYGHPADFSAVYADQIAELMSQLQLVNRVLDGLFDEVKLVRTKGSKKSAGRYIDDVEMLMGSNTQFLREKILSDTDALDDQLLYIHVRESNTSIPLLPLLIMSSSPKSDKNACYFYSKTVGGKTRFISHYSNSEPERITEGELTLSSAISAINALKAD